MFNIILGVAAVGVGLYILNELDERAGEEKKKAMGKSTRISM